jgi:hypothetical protein
MDIPTIESWRDLDDALIDASWGRHAEHARSTLVFRGLARSSYSNVSSLARLTGDYPALERHLLRNFRKYAHQAAPGPTTWDWLALGQHHGLPTRLIDWTFSPYVALHFATASWPDDDAVLWAVDCVTAHEALPPVLRGTLEQEGSMVFTTEQLAAHATDLGALERLSEGGEAFALFFEPPTLDERIANQAAVLSVISDPTCHMDTWLSEHPDAWRAWRIPVRLKREVRERLDQAQITERVLLPGLDGLAAYLRRYYSPHSVQAGGTDVDGGGSMDDTGPHPQEEGSMS